MDHLDKVRLLMKAVRKRAEDNNLGLKNFVLIPSEDGDNDFVQLGFVITPEALETIEETQQRATDDSFEQMMAGVSLDGFEASLPEEVQGRVDQTADDILGVYDDESDAGEENA